MNGRKPGLGEGSLGTDVSGCFGTAPPIDRDDSQVTLRKTQGLDV